MQETKYLEDEYATFLLKINNSSKTFEYKLNKSEYLDFLESRVRTSGVMYFSGSSSKLALKSRYPELRDFDIEDVLIKMNFEKDYVKPYHIDIRNRIISCIASICSLDKDFVSSKEHFRDDIGMDSLDYVELMLDLEFEFDLDIPDEEVSKIETITGAVEYIKTR